MNYDNFPFEFSWRHSLTWVGSIGLLLTLGFTCLNKGGVQDAQEWRGTPIAAQDGLEQELSETENEEFNTELVVQSANHGRKQFKASRSYREGNDYEYSGDLGKVIFDAYVEKPKHTVDSMVISINGASRQVEFTEKIKNGVPYTIGNQSWQTLLADGKPIEEYKIHLQIQYKDGTSPTNFNIKVKKK
tara:strand:+ start:8938 stop:9501 length:564 start_codon:yes stop_codon:yes gene_type:complete